MLVPFLSMSLATASKLRGHDVIRDQEPRNLQQEVNIESDISYSLKNEAGIVLSAVGNTPFGANVPPGEYLSSESSSFKFFRRTCPYSLGTYDDCFIIQHETSGHYLQAPDDGDP